MLLLIIIIAALLGVIILILKEKSIIADLENRLMQSESTFQTKVEDEKPSVIIEEPEDIAKLVAFLASSEADFVTGQAINVTGGLLLSH